MASITITTTPPQDQRISPAFGSILGLGRDATVAEVKQALIGWIRASVQDYERRQNQSLFTPNPIDPT